MIPITTQRAQDARRDALGEALRAPRPELDRERQDEASAQSHGEPRGARVVADEHADRDADDGGHDPHGDDAADGAAGSEFRNGHAPIVAHMPLGARMPQRCADRDAPLHAESAAHHALHWAHGVFHAGKVTHWHSFWS